MLRLWRDTEFRAPFLSNLRGHAEKETYLYTPTGISTGNHLQLISFLWKGEEVRNFFVRIDHAVSPSLWLSIATGGIVGTVLSIVVYLN